MRDFLLVDGYTRQAFVSPSSIQPTIDLSDLAIDSTDDQLTANQMPWGIYATASRIYDIGYVAY